MPTSAVTLTQILAIISIYNPQPLILISSVFEVNIIQNRDVHHPEKIIKTIVRIIDRFGC